ncbi:matrix metalloproteinase-24-like [Saccostrea echinata]|uniref:matrix metalloproteinase-24-like n=1 Tax=Saccostrea echinata TaxID=191078 RepID=UPI002A7FE238|nr:matrix metalloproteinase-24-like [Saccostrea echinata]
MADIGEPCRRCVSIRKRPIFVAIIGILYLTFLVGLTTATQEVQQLSEGANYLMKYGYISADDERSGSLRSPDSIKQAVRQFQRFAGLPITGILDKATVDMMGKPRCGVKDNVGNANKARRRRYALHGSKWSEKDLTFRISKYSDKMSKEEVDKELQRAFDEWGKVTPLTFTKVTGKADIDVRFEKRWHGDNNPFDGRGQTLAHAYFPRYGGDAHFDDDERWTINIRSGVNFFQVAVHEIGHSLGLAHSDDYRALMAPFYKGYTQEFRLDSDDVEAIQTLYGTPASRRKPKPKPTKQVIVPKPTKATVTKIPEICRDPSIDAITRTKDGNTYVFKGNYHYRLNGAGIDKGYPRPISWDWKGVDGPVDAVLTWENGFTYIFKGTKYWKFFNRRRIYGPNKIKDGFRGVPDNVEAAMVWGGNGKTYFFKGGQYWRYSGRKVDFGYPRPTTHWRGLPKKVTAAFRWKNGRTYFFSDRKYYRFNDQLFMTDTSYPREVATWWLGCPDQGTNANIKDPYVRLETNRPDEQWIIIDDTNVSPPQPQTNQSGRLFDPLSPVYSIILCFVLFHLNRWRFP